MSDPVTHEPISEDDAIQYKAPYVQGRQTTSEGPRTNAQVPFEMKYPKRSFNPGRFGKAALKPALRNYQPQPQNQNGKDQTQD